MSVTSLMEPIGVTPERTEFLELAKQEMSKRVELKKFHCPRGNCNRVVRVFNHPLISGGRKLRKHPHVLYYGMN